MACEEYMLLTVRVTSSAKETREMRRQEKSCLSTQSCKAIAGVLLVFHHDLEET